MEKAVNFVGTLESSVDSFRRDAVILETRSKEIHDEAVLAKGKAEGIKAALDFITRNRGVILSAEELETLKANQKAKEEPKVKN